MLRAGVCFGGVSSCLSVRVSAQNLENYWSEIDKYSPWWTLEVFGIWWHLTLIFDLENYFLIQAIPFKWLYLATSFSVWRFIFKYLGQGSVLRSWVQGQGHDSENAVACNSKTTGRKFLWLNQNISYDNARSNLKLLTFDLYLWPWCILVLF